MACSPSVRDRQLVCPSQVAGERALPRSSRAINRIISTNLRQVPGGLAYGKRLRQTIERSTDTLGLLPLWACQAASGKSSQAIPVLAAWRLLRLAAKLLDDLADGDSACTSAEAIGLATGYLFLAPLALGELSKHGVSPAKTEQLTMALQGTALRACAGQYGEIAQSSPIDPAGWLDIARSKSGEPCAWAAWAGALVSGAAQRKLSAFRDYGLHLGILLQVADDFGGVWQPTDRGDLRSGHLNLACCYAGLVASGEQRVLLEGLLQLTRQGNVEAESQLQDALTNLGSQVYLLVVANEHRQKARAALQKIGIVDGPLISLLDQVWPALPAASRSRMAIP